MAKIKVAVANNTEEVERLKAMILTRAETLAQAHALFSDGASKASKENRAQLNELFLQAPANQTMHPSLQKTAAPRVAALFEKLAGQGLSEAQRRFPELQKVAQIGTQIPPRPAANLKPRVSATRTTSDTTGTIPVQSNLSGGSA